MGLNAIANPFFATMVARQSYQLKDEITPIGVAFYITPYINGAIRVGNLAEKTLLFESMLDYKGYEMVPSTKRGAPKGSLETVAEQACRVCGNLKNKQTASRDSALEAIEEIIEEKKLLENKILTVKLKPEMAIDKNLTGLVANQLMAKYQRPVLLLNRVEDENRIKWEGSGRGYDKSRFKDLRQFLKDSQLVDLAEGHKNALGVRILDDNFDDFVKYANNELADFVFTPCHRVDFIFNGNNFNSQDIIDIAELKSYWGQGIEEPIIALENVKVNGSNLFLMSPDRNPTLKINLSNGTSLIKFKSSQEEYETLYTNGYYNLNIIGRCEKNEWNGNITAQIIIEDYEITEKRDYYF